MLKIRNTELKLTKKEVSNLYKSMNDKSGIGLNYMIMVVFAAIVASFGLLTNSTAVIIGAMLISPIMGPILRISFSINTGDKKMMATAFTTTLVGVAIAIGISALSAWLFPNPELTSEILARTKPNLADLVIAIASGAAGSFALATSSGLTAFAGVAIATALMPPLCVVGIGIALQDASVTIGGLLLFLSNLIGINLAAATVFRLLGITVPGVDSEIYDEMENKKVHKKRRGRFILSVVATIVIILPLALISVITVYQNQVDSRVRVVLENYFSENYSESYVKLESYDYNIYDSEYRMDIVIRTDASFTDKDVTNMQNLLEKEMALPVVITLEYVYTNVIDQNSVTQEGP